MSDDNDGERHLLREIRDAAKAANTILRDIHNDVHKGLAELLKVERAQLGELATIRNRLDNPPQPPANQRLRLLHGKPQPKD